MSRVEPDLLVHASNVTGLGAAEVVFALLEAVCAKLDRPAIVYLPTHGRLAEFNTTNAAVTVKRFTRVLPRSFSRAVDTAAPELVFPRTKRTLVLGDIPLARRQGQVVLAQQAHLVAPDVDPHVSGSVRFRIARALFARHLRDVSKIIVQSAPFGDGLSRSYPEFERKIEVVPHPAPSIPSAVTRRDASTRGSSLRLFYPAAGYPHKNHNLIRQMAAATTPVNSASIKLRVTLSERDFAPFASIPWVSNLGPLSRSDCFESYAASDALFFPSLLESYGLPLLEAMSVRLPIVCADRPYARWLCGDEAIYFNPRDPADGWRAIDELQRRIEGGWQPDWSTAKSRLVPTWDEVADRFLAALEKTGSRIE